MNRIKPFLIFLFLTNLIYGQDVKMTTEYSSENQDVSDMLNFESIDFWKIKFTGKDITDKSFILTVKEMWDGKIKSTDTIINTSKYPKNSEVKSDTLKLKVMAKRTDEPKLKLWFRFPKFVIKKKYDAIMSDDYSLRNTGVREKIEYGKNFYFLTYILPYEKDGFKFWCDVDDSGKNVEDWGKEFGIKHYVIFEMKFIE
ncbi:hypothetical protein EVU94_05000 [Flavobacteriaceae bacterium 144Ye]|uniref:hypothetical protein n=1 Tax=Gaetbulibacter sp. PBL-D1 TaxID=3422594 RepID=UPI00101CCD8D|nr:hypothetical protein EVU94_05000 [Flavobacteriaceae bacterium 144Ye]